MRGFNSLASQTFHSAKGEESIFLRIAKNMEKSSGNETEILKCHVVAYGVRVIQAGTGNEDMLSVWA